MEKFQYAKIDEYLQSKSYTVGTNQSQRSVLTELYNIVNVYNITNESLEKILTGRMNGTKSANTCKMIKSVTSQFCIFLNGQSVSTVQTTKSVTTNTYQESKDDFKLNLLKIVKEIRSQQKESNIDKITSFYIREGKQLLNIFGYLSEIVLLNTITARFNKKPSDVEVVKGIISKIIPNPSGKTFLELPKKGEFIKFVLEQGAKIISKADIIEQNPRIDPSSLNYEDYIPKVDPEYIWLPNERELIATLTLLNENLWVTGSAGLGKSSMLLQFAYEEQIPIVRTGCNYEADPSDQFYEQGFDGTRVNFTLQNVGKAFYFANMVGVSMEIEEELNSSNEATMIILHSATDDIKSLDTKIGKIELNQGVKCLIAGTGNIGYKGTSDLTPALASRLIPYEKNEPTDAFILKNIWK